MIKRSIFGIILFAILACSDREGKVFDNPMPDATGIYFSNDLSPSDELNILDYLYFYNGGGVAIGDINNDSLPDIFFSGNQVKNKIYLNKGNLKFEDISQKAGIEGNSSWNTGSVMGDVNGDGLLDIYVCAVVGINGFNGHNELFINNGDTTFTESAEQYGLDYDSFSSSAAFLDYDQDGDLDIYLLNHAVHTQESYGGADLRYKRNYQTGDKLLRNDGGKFVEVSEEAGIYGGINGYGLGLAVSDFNQDGWPDIYVGNDFHEDDYYYLNNGDGTFTESLKKYFGHTSRFSMGNDVADINHDGWPDLLSLDMLPEEETILKSSEGDGNLQIQKLRTETYGYHYQFTRNMLHINRPNGVYMESALLSGVSATDWSWSALFGDYNQDGEEDIFVSNGIPKRPNNLDYINFVSNGQIRKKLANTKLVDQEALNLMPSGKTHNYVFKGMGNISFEDESGIWIAKDTLVSGATAMADLDLDGDLDLVINNLNSPASLYINKTNDKANYLKLKFDLPGQNRFGIGTKVFSYHNGSLQYRELYTARGFQASSEPIIHLGYGQATKVDSIRVVWPDHTFQILKDVPVNQTLTLRPEGARPFNFSSLRPKMNTLFEKETNNLGIDFKHKEDSYSDFNRQKLMPYQISDRGPATAIGDLDQDGKDDIFFGGSKFIPSKIYIQKDSSYTVTEIPSISKDSIKEDVDAIIADFNNDGKNDLFLASGGADFFDTMKPLLDSYYLRQDSIFTDAKLPEYYENAAVVKANDFDGDGDLDLFVGNEGITNDFGKIPSSYLLRNDQGTFTMVDNKELGSVGMVTDAVWHDFDNDGSKDLIVIGEWMSPTFFKNTNGKLSKVEMIKNNINGLWRSIIPFDIDNDGDMDYLLGNWGSNTKFKASETYPMKMYYGDLDKDGQTETITAIEKNGKYYPLEGLDELASQMVSIKKKFTAYSDFAGKDLDGIFGEKMLADAKVLTVSTLQSGFLRNNQGRYDFVPFLVELQLSPITAFLSYDFDGDGKEEILVGGNYFGVKPYHGRFDSFPGALIKGEKNVILGDELGLELAHKSVRHLHIIHLKNRPYLLVTINDDKAQVYRINLKK